jgi:hypothetical protein
MSGKLFKQFPMQNFYWLIAGAFITLAIIFVPNLFFGTAEWIFNPNESTTEKISKLDTLLGFKSMFDGFFGALLGTLVSVVVIVTSVKGLKAQISHETLENDKGRERDALVEFIVALSELPKLIEKNDFKQGDFRIRVFDGWKIAVAKLGLQIVEPDDTLFWVLGLWEQRFGDEGHAYWRTLRLQSHQNQHIGGIHTGTNFLVSKMAEYGRADESVRLEIVASMAKRLSEEYHGLQGPPEPQLSFNELKEKNWPFDYRHPPVG